MDIKLLITFIVLSVINVILQTIKSLATIKCGKGIASLINAIAYGLYTIVTVYTMCELPLLVKALIVAITNLIGVFIVKSIEEKMRKDKLWKIEVTARECLTCGIVEALTAHNIPYNYVQNADSSVSLFNIYCATQRESAEVKKIIDRFQVKYFVSESKIL